MKESRGGGVKGMHCSKIHNVLVGIALGLYGFLMKYLYKFLKKLKRTHLRMMHYSSI